MRSLLTILAAAAIPSLLVAQSFVVSPPSFATIEGGTWSDSGFSSVGRYQQICADLRGTARTFQALAFRRDALVPTNATLIGRTLDFELLCSNSNLAAASTTFATNYVGSPVTVFTRKMIGLPDFTQLPGVQPAPWTIHLPFDVPFAYAGTSDFLYEWKTYSSSTGNGYVVDGVSGRDSSWIGGSTSVGLGCYTTNGNMRVRGVFTTNTSTNSLGVTWSVDRGPNTLTAGLLVGLNNPNAYLPNVCPNTGGNYLYTDAMLFSLIGSLDALGTWNLPVFTVPYSPSYAGASLTAQAVALDLGQLGLGVAVSNGIATTVAGAPAPIQITRIVATGAGTATAATGTRLVGLGYVARLQH